MKKIIIAIDGYSSCGKSTMAKALAKRLGYLYLDTGAMYRATTLFLLEHKREKMEDLQSLQEEDLEDLKIDFRLNPLTGNGDTYLSGINVEQEIRSLRVSQWVSKVSAIPLVREKMVFQQREIGKEGGIVLDGRDIGTKVFPQAELKIFLTASSAIRAKRRYDELKAKGEEVSIQEIMENIEQRDLQDTTRKESPLRKAEDAILLDNSEMSIEEQNEWLDIQVKKIVAP
ncbi:MAG TPA: (d)CMP kinase [Porphyromonadaceae bacterium]|nr:(d)CMP kinase [Porphyromonadaceae bacterium]